MPTPTTTTTIDSDFVRALTEQLVAELATRRSIEDLIEAVSW